MIRGVYEYIRNGTSGQGLVEYGLILALVSVVAVGSLGGVGEKVSDTFYRTSLMGGRLAVENSDERVVFGSLGDIQTDIQESKVLPVHQEDMMLWHDALYPTSSVNKWTDMSGQGKDSDLINFRHDKMDGWSDETLDFDESGWVRLNDVRLNDERGFTNEFLIRVNKDKRNHLHYNGESIKNDIYGSRYYPRYRFINTWLNSASVPGDYLGNITHIADTWEDGVLKTYVNGELKRSWETDKTFNDERIHGIGRYIDQGLPSVNLYYNRIYDRALTADEVKTNMEALRIDSSLLSYAKEFRLEDLMKEGIPYTLAVDVVDKDGPLGVWLGRDHFAGYIVDGQLDFVGVNGVDSIIIKSLGPNTIMEGIDVFVR